MRLWMALCILAVTPTLVGGACSDNGDGVGIQGGSSGNGAGGATGGSNNGGSSSTAKGGSGGTSSATGGVTSNGGKTASGGTTASGGIKDTGGSTAKGGSTGTGGSTAKGGATGTGGTIAKGGSTGTGGLTGTGGIATGTGGTSSKGGATGTGGVVGTGGATGAGGSTSTQAKFSFFVTSYAALQKIAGNTKGLGGDLRHGETGAGAGLRGADKICAEIAESSLAGAGTKTWRAFLSATADESGKQVNAIERIGSGPWYDRIGRLFANNLDELYYDRPQNAANAIKNDFPNETGTLNQNPDGTGNVDNHDTLTGTDSQGKLYGSTATCSDWTSTATSGSKPRVGHSWPTSASACSTTSTAGSTGSGIGSGMGMGGGMGGMCNWMSALDEAGCAPGVNLIQNGGPGNDGTVGSGGGYGGFYCFALTP